MLGEAYYKRQPRQNSNMCVYELAFSEGPAKQVCDFVIYKWYMRCRMWGTVPALYPDPHPPTRRVQIRVQWENIDPACSKTVVVSDSGDADGKYRLTNAGGAGARFI